MDKEKDMDSIKCYTCKQYLPKEEFWKDKTIPRGYGGECKNCKAERSRNYYLKNREKLIEKGKKYLETPKARILQYQRHLKYRGQNPLRHKAYELLRTSLLKGDIVKKPCEVCNNEKSQAHHDDYNKPLDVIWLCARHHKALEGKSVDKEATREVLSLSCLQGDKR